MLRKADEGQGDGEGRERHKGRGRRFYEVGKEGMRIGLERNGGKGEFGGGGMVR